MNKKDKSIGELLTEGELKLKENGNQRAAEESLLLLSYLLNRENYDLILNRTSDVSSGKIHQYYRWIQQRAKGVPLQYITGFQNFMGSEFKIIKGVFIPRPETEILVEKVIHLIESMPEKDKYSFLDIGVGSGVIPVTICHHLKKSFKNIHFHAIDISQKAIGLAKENAKKYNCENKITFYHGDLFLPLRYLDPPVIFDGIISNPPYISLDEWTELPDEIYLHEPGKALYGGEDGLSFYREIIRQSPNYLRKEDGFLALEIGQNQSNAICKMFVQNGSYKKELITFHDYYQNNRGIIAFTGT